MIGIVLMTLFAIAQDGATASGSLGLVPPGTALPADDRPLWLLQHEFLEQVFDVEKRAMEREAALPEAAAQPERATRIEKDRVMLAQIQQGAGVAPSLGPRPISTGTLPAVDRFLRGFALERIGSRALSPIDDLQRWRAENETFLGNGDLAARDRAVLLRARALRTMVVSAQLRALLAKLDAGPLTDEDRQTQIVMLQAMFPDASLPAPALLGGGGGAAPGPAQEPTQGSLPRLDGVEIPSVQLPDLTAPSAADLAGASALASQMLANLQNAGPAGRSAYRPNRPPPRPRPQPRAPSPRARFRFPGAY